MPNIARTGCLLLGLLIGEHAFSQTTTTTTVANNTAAPPSTSTSTSQQPPNGVEVEIGLVSRIGGPSISNYQSSSGTLSLTNLGRATPQLLTGLGFSCETGTNTTATTTTTAASSTKTVTKAGADSGGFCNHGFDKHLGVFVSAQFGSGSNQTISGYSIGMTYAVGKYLRLLAGFSMTPVSEISPGFANAAAQYVTRNPTLFPGVNPGNLSSNVYGAFDGFQTVGTAPAASAAPTSSIYYPGSVTETHYRGGLIVGVALPINIYNLLGGNSKTPSQ